MKKYKIISLLIMIVFILSSINIVFAASTPRITLNDYQFKLTTKKAVTVNGTISIAKGQNIVLYKGSTKIKTIKAKNTGGTTSFSITIPKSKIKQGTNTFKIRSEKKKMLFVTLLNASNTKTITVNYNKPPKKTQTISASNITLVKGNKKSLGAKASSGLKCTYKSSNPKVVSINKKGQLTAKKVGTVTITINQKGNTKYKAAPAKKVKVTSRYNKTDDMLAVAKANKNSTPYVIVTQFNYYGSYGRTKIFWKKNWAVINDSTSTGSKAQAKGKEMGLKYMKGKANVDDDNKTRDADRPGPGGYSNKHPKFHEFWVTKYSGGNAIHTHLYKVGGRELYKGDEQVVKNGKIVYKNISGGCTRVNDTMANWIFTTCPGDVPYYIYNY